MMNIWMGCESCLLFSGIFMMVVRGIFISLRNTGLRCGCLPRFGSFSFLASILLGRLCSLNALFLWSFCLSRILSPIPCFISLIPPNILNRQIIMMLRDRIHNLILNRIIFWKVLLFFNQMRRWIFFSFWMFIFIRLSGIWFFILFSRRRTKTSLFKLDVLILIQVGTW